MKPLVLNSTSILLLLKNDLKIFKPTKTYEKGRLVLKWLLLERTTSILLNVLKASLSKHTYRAMEVVHVGKSLLTKRCVQLLYRY